MLVALAVSVAFPAVGLARAEHAGNRTFVAVLPQIGTVYARYDCSHARRFALGIHVFRMSQTTFVRYRAGSHARDRELQPGDPTSWFRYTTRRVAWLAAAAGGENGTVVGWVRVVGYSRNSPYACDDVSDPPRATVQIYPRDYPPPGYSLRKLIG
ncbi:MAG TPA: hypothetical protein VLW49_03530 [Gaiellaceae bacterium]|nr:hypothetical protein [Gaiellaceae bacterium]